MKDFDFYILLAFLLSLLFLECWRETHRPGALQDFKRDSAIYENNR